MLDYSDFEKIYCHSVEDYQNLNDLKNKFILDEIKRRQDMVKDKESSIKQLQYENNLILTDICNVIKDDMFKSQKYNVLAYFNMETFYDIFRYFNHQESFEEEHSSKYVEQTKEHLNVITSILKQEFFGKYAKDFELVQIYDFNYTQAYEFVFKSKEHEIMINVPMYQNANAENYLDMLHGCYVNYREGEYSWQWIAGNIEYKICAEEVQKWLKEQYKAKKEKKKDEN